MQLAQFKGLRADVLMALKHSQPLTAKQLAGKLGVSTNAVRHHLKELEAGAFVVYGREQRGIGAPTFAYRLSAAGEALFPRRYAEALTRLVERVVEKEGREAAVELFEDHFRQLTERARAELATADTTERVALVTRLMNDAGYMAEWQEAEGVFRISEHNCAIRAVAERFPEACVAEQRFFEEVLGGAVERRSQITHGCNACEYAVSFPAESRAQPVEEHS
ncbi:MAG TPA: HTH domain-containing protein [Gemmatimonadales bacterium]|nr:HTH domain-containing protein [Gemmatimonadales bacterium]